MPEDKLALTVGAVREAAGPVQTGFAQTLDKVRSRAHLPDHSVRVAKQALLAA